jgi:FlaA1/EpsC-like NDP-sugar epimerase
MVLWALGHAQGGEIFVPKIPSYRVVDIASAIAPECKQVVVGIRPGEKIHEEMITSSDSLNTVDLGKYYAILSSSGAYDVKAYCSLVGGKPIQQGYAYNSGTNINFLSVSELRTLIGTHVSTSLDAGN